MKKDGFDPVICESIRTNARQQFLFGFGRKYDDGRGVVTKADSAHKSWHFYGLAVDIVSAKHGWNPPKGFKESMKKHCARLGLEWGGLWTGMPDWPHVQLGNLGKFPFAKALSLRTEGGNAKVWEAVGASGSGE